jgi:hypothetical protein
MYGLVLLTTSYKIVLSNPENATKNMQEISKNLKKGRNITKFLTSKSNPRRQEAIDHYIEKAMYGRPNSEFIEDYPDQFWIRLYAYFKNYETNKNLTQIQFDNIVRETNELVKLNKTVSALKYLNNYFKDYNLVREFALQNINPELQSDAVGNITSNNIIF